MTNNNNDNNPNDLIEETTDFGYQRLPISEKTRRVGEVFDSVAHQYDIMNDLMSLGLHRLWKRATISLAGLRPNEHVLDLAGGTGDLSCRLAKRLNAGGHVTLADINAAMIQVGRDRALDRGITGNISYVQADAETLPFPDNTFDCIIIGFGLRNVTRKQNALASMFRVLRPGGRLLILEFSKLSIPALNTLYDTYSFKVLPKLGEWVAKDADSYRYLAESIRKHPDQQTLKQMMFDAGFEGVDFYNLSGGIVAIHRGYKY